MDEHDLLAERFEANRVHLRAVGYRMLGSLSEADDAVQEAWLRLSGADTSAVENLEGWLTTVVARVCLDMLRSRKSRHEQPFDVHVPDPIVDREDGSDPEHEALIADAVGLALLVVLDALTPAERLAFVLHDLFGLSFDEIAPIVERSPAAARQLASRARRRVRAQPTVPDADIHRQRAVVDAFLAAAREGDFDALLELLDPDAVLRADAGALTPGASRQMRGAQAVAEGARTFARLAELARPALVNGAAGFVITQQGRPLSVAGFTVRHGKIAEIDILADPQRLSQIDVSAVGYGRRRNLHGVGDVSNERIGSNESLFRETNEGIERGLWPGEGDQRVPFRCECGLLACAETVRLTPAEYEHVRADSRRFAVVPGHEILRAEVVVERHSGYLLVEKVGEAGEVADELDPRD
jgi:RNA polymerase sigma factor (sigma-70 family)